MGYKVYKIKLEDEKQQEQLYMINDDLIDYWRKPSLKYNITGQAMVPPSLTSWFEQRLNDFDIAKEVFVDDVYEYLMKKDEVSIKSFNNVSDTAFNLYEYNRYNEIVDYLRALERTYDNSEGVNLRVVENGITAEGRPLVYIQLTNSTTNSNDKPIVIVEAGIIPRQWITVPSSMNIVHKLLDSDHSRLLNGYEWIIIPVLNPDGYEYTHTNLRLWMKSRSVRSHLGAICPGVNINRNFDIAWLQSDSSSSPCSHLYGGIEAFSEAESRLVRSSLESNKGRTRLYISLQNTGGYISYPWQYERAASGMFLQHHLLGLDMVAAMGDRYYLDVASSAYGDRASGTSTDYMRQNEVLYTFNIDIAPSGEDGVIVPREEVPMIAENVWRAVSVAAESLL
ncbi:unnamed protein product, partial [Iphiclides podalirius]